MIFVIHGQDLFRKQLRINELKAEYLAPGMEALNLVQAENPDLIDFVSLLGTPGFGFGKKLIIIKNFEYLENKAEDKEVSKILDALNSIPEDTIVIFDSEKITGTIKLCKNIKSIESASTEDFKAFNSWEIKPAAIWLKGSAQFLIKELDSKLAVPNLETLEYFADQVGVEDSSKLHSELKRLIILAKPITDQLIDQECAARHDIFKLARLIAENKIPAANKEIEKMIRTKEIHLGVLAVIETSISKYLKLKLALAQRPSDTEIASMLGTSPQRLYYQKKEVQVMQESHLDKLLSKMVKLEFEVKTGRMPIDRGLRLLVNSN